MGTISSGVGLVSGINSGQIIDQLIAIDARPRLQLQRRIENNNAIKLAFADLQARLSGILNSANLLTRPSTFQSASGQSSNPDVLGVTVSPTAAAGNYQFTVARTVTSQSAVSTGFSDLTALLKPGTIRIGLGGGEVTSSPQLSELNGGNGVQRGQFRITDRAGNAANIDIRGAVSLDDVLTRINTAGNLQVRASLGDNGLVLTDTSGGTGALRVEELAGGRTAADLGILGTSPTSTLAGSSINSLGRNSLLASVNDGIGLRTRPGNTDLRITTGNGESVDINLDGSRTLGDVLDKLNSVAAGRYSADIAPDGRGLRIVDLTGGDDPLTVTSLNDSKAARDLGLEFASGNGSVTGSPIRAGLGSVLLKNLNGGQGINFGTLTLTDRSGNYAEVALAGASSLSDLISRINDAGTGVRAAVNRAGTGLEITDVSGGSGNLEIGSLSGPNVAALLGIEGSFDTSRTRIDGGSLKRQFISENSALTSLNGGRGISPGTFRITNSNGVSSEVSLNGLTNPTLQDVISIINGKNIGVVASINDQGTGLQLTDLFGGPGRLTVTDLSGSAAQDLRIAGTADGNTLVGAYAKDIEVTASDTLQSLITKLNAANVGISAAAINDGSGVNPFRLSVTAVNAGLNGRFTFDGGATGLDLNTLVRAQNAAVLLGSADADNPVLITSNTNTLTNVVPGVTLNLSSASANPVNVSVSQTPDNAVNTLRTLVTTFNGLTTRLGELTKFDTATNARGILLGDATASSITATLFSSLQSPVRGAGRYTLLSQIGLTVGANNQLAFDEAKFKEAYAADPASTQRLFTAFNTVISTTTTAPSGTLLSQTTTTNPFGTETVGITNTVDGDGNAVRTEVKLEGFGFAYNLQRALNRLIDPVSGVVVQQNKSIDDANKVFEARINSISAQLDAKRLRLQRQFAQMEQVLSQLQSQQTAIGRIQSIQMPQNNNR